MKKFIDTHCHIYKEYYDNIPLLVNHLENNNVKTIINNAVDVNTMKEVLSFCDEYKDYYCALGIHPEYVDKYNESDITFLKDNINKNCVVAVGEIGLDYHYEGYDKEKQIILFKRQLEIAKDCEIPVIIHSRDATQDTINILKEYKLNGVIHSFSGSYETAMEYIKMGYYLGINGVVTFKNAKIIDTIKKIGLEHFVLETDSPYLTPVPYRGEKNNPSYINLIIDFLSERLEMSKDRIIDITNANAIKLFNKIK